MCPGKFLFFVYDLLSLPKTLNLGHDDGFWAIGDTTTYNSPIEIIGDI